MGIQIILILVVVCFIVLKLLAKKKQEVPRPAAPTIKSMETLMDKYIYKFSIPAPKATDVVTRELYSVVNGTESMVTLDVTATTYEMQLTEGDTISMYLVDIDDAGNRSAHGDILGFIVVDVVPPAAPEAPVITDVIYVEPVIEEPIVEEPVVTDPVMEEPIVEEPTTEEPVVTDPVVEEPIVEEPVIEEPIVTDPVVEEPIVEEPTTEEPIVEEPVIADPVVEEPIVEEPTTEETTDEEMNS